MELLVQWVTPAPQDPEECRERRAKEGRLESSGPLDLRDPQENLLALTWQL